MSKELRLFQLEILKMIKDVDVLFRNNNIEYFILGGSVLGAVRHKGFIPWDDDFDIGIKRAYFDKAESLLSKLGDKYIYEATDEHSIPDAPIGHLYLKSTGKKSLGEMPTIDVFALDGAPGNMNSQKIQVFIGHLYNLCVYGCPSKNQGRFKNALTYLFLFLFKNKSREVIKKYSYRYITKWSSISSPYITNLYGYSNRKELMPMEYFSEALYLQFENLKLPAPNKPHEYLTTLYGDYMKLPAIKDRQPTHRNLRYIEYWGNKVK